MYLLKSSALECIYREENLNEDTPYREKEIGLMKTVQKLQSLKPGLGRCLEKFNETQV